MFLHRFIIGFILGVFFFNASMKAYGQNGIEPDSTTCVFPKPIEAILPAAYLDKERITGLDAFWAQEYVGADLLREKLQETHYLEDVTEDLVQVWDSSNRFYPLHGEVVSHLIAGPFPSAVIPQAYPIDVKMISGPRTYEELYRQCRSEGSCPLSINSSVDWASRITKEVFYALNRREGTRITTSAGNWNTYISKFKGGLAHHDRLIVVASLDPYGDPSHFSNFSTQTTISAPSDNMIRSYSFDGRPLNFGGSSGAAPLTRGTLTTFERITGYAPDTRQEKTLLRKTALNFPRLPSSSSMGYGILNAYKIGEVAFQLRGICQGNAQCLTSYLNRDSTYKFDLEEEKEIVLKEARVAFPTCFLEGEISLEVATCEDKHRILKRLRQIAFLNAWDQRFWNIISCIKRQSGLTKHAEFYTRLAERSDLSDEDIINDMVARQDYYTLLQYAISPENLHSIVMPLFNNPSTQSQFLTLALRSIEDILNYEVISNIGGFLTKALRHPNADNNVFTAVNDILAFHFHRIPNAENLLRYMVHRQRQPFPTKAIVNNLGHLPSLPFFLRKMLDDERVRNIQLTQLVNVGFVRHHDKIPDFRAYVDEIIHHKHASGTVIRYLFSNVIADYNHIPDAKGIASPLIQDERLGGTHLGRMAETLIEHYDQHPDFREMLPSIRDNERANAQTMVSMAYSLMEHGEHFEDVNEQLLRVIRNEKADEGAAERAAIGFIRFYNQPSNMDLLFQSITDNEHIAKACGSAGHVLISRASPQSEHYEPEISFVSEKLNLFFSHCDGQIDKEGLSAIQIVISLNTFDFDGQYGPIEWGMMQFIIRQEVIDRQLLDDFSDMVEKTHLTDSQRRWIQEQIQAQNCRLQPNSGEKQSCK